MNFFKPICLLIILNCAFIPNFAAGKIESRIDVKASTGGNIINGSPAGDEAGGRIESRVKINTKINGVTAEDLDISGRPEGDSRNSEITVESKTSADKSRARTETKTEIDGRTRDEIKEFDIRNNSAAGKASIVNPKQSEEFGADSDSDLRKVIQRFAQENMEISTEVERQADSAVLQNNGELNRGENLIADITPVLESQNAKSEPNFAVNGFESWFYKILNRFKSLILKVL